MMNAEHDSEIQQVLEKEARALELFRVVRQHREARYAELIRKNECPHYDIKFQESLVKKERKAKEILQAQVLAQATELEQLKSGKADLKKRLHESDVELIKTRQSLSETKKQVVVLQNYLNKADIDSEADSHQISPDSRSVSTISTKVIHRPGPADSIVESGGSDFDSKSATSCASPALSSVYWRPKAATPFAKPQPIKRRKFDFVLDHSNCTAHPTRRKIPKIQSTTSGNANANANLSSLQNHTSMALANSHQMSTCKVLKTSSVFESGCSTPSTSVAASTPTASTSGYGSRPH